MKKTDKNFIDLIGGPLKISELRQITNPEGRKGSWLRVLNDLQLAEVYFRLREGEAIYSVTKMIQKDWKINTSSSLKSMCRAVRNFKSKAIGEICNDIQSVGGTKKDVKKAERIAKTIAEKVDTIQEYIWMINNQKKRLEGMMKYEMPENKKNKQFFLEMTDKAFRNFREMLDGYAQHCIRLGILDAQTPEINIRMKHTFDTVMQNVIDNDKTKLIQACDSFSQKLEDLCVDLVRNEDGSYSKIEKTEKNEE